ncbi:MAG: rhamnogalacturonan acetylesterase [Chitinispirillaceae bacterium]|nr:rhamnogalacturonan acetylesterase [Chitinispirillaceae bacterium]
MRIKTFIFFLVFLLSMSAVTTKPKLYIVGDSTACIYSSSQYPRMGWAQVLQDYFSTDSVQVDDKALSGRSSKSFYDEGHWTPVKNALRKGDYVIIQFGHNDEKTDDAARGTLPGTTFKQYLLIYIDDAIAKGAIPILATPMERNQWNATAIKSSHITADGDYPQAIRDLAAAKKIDLIDATALTKVFFENIGKDSTTNLFLNLAAGESPNYPSGNTDNTHLQERGAKAVSQLIVNDIAYQNLLPLSMWIEGNTTALTQSPEPNGSRMPHDQAISFPGRSAVSPPRFFDLSGRSALSAVAPSGRFPRSGVFLLQEASGTKATAVTEVGLR